MESYLYSIGIGVIALIALGRAAVVLLHLISSVTFLSKARRRDSRGVDRFRSVPASPHCCSR